ncbi:MAG: CopG family ribbon-helix-helix protein [Desulfurococcales archaeon]|nr:CopG family ribbon-helix-helix protein [Desulfurococcales archaeon]
MARRRFGVSLPEDLASKLDSLSERLGLDRSRLVEQAVRAFLDDYSHLLVPHRCSGVMILSCRSGSEEALARVMEEYRDIVSTRFHSHTGDRCVEAVVVEGDTSRITRLHQDLEKAGCRARYIPLPGDGG